MQVESQNYAYEGKSYVLINAIGSGVVPDGKYLYDPGTRRIEIQWVQGIGSDKAAAPQARLMATVISGILNRQLALAAGAAGRFSGGLHRTAGHSLAALCRGFLPLHRHHDGHFRRWPGPLARRANAQIQPRRRAAAESEIGPGSLFASGLIAGGGIFGLFGIVIALLEDQEFPYHIFRAGLFQIGPKIVGGLADSNVFAVLLFVLLAASQFYFARKKMQ